MSESSTAGPAEGEPFDVEKFARDTIRAIEFADDDAELLEDRVMRLEEIVAARWPRSTFLRWRLAREIRASVRGYDERAFPRGDFRGRRVQWASERISAAPRDRERRQDGAGPQPQG